MSQRGAVILDRDRTILVEKQYLSDPAGVELLPESAAGLLRMQRMGWPLVIVTNQSGIARGYFDESTLKKIHERMLELLSARGVWIEEIYHCPHHPSEQCGCRKPGRGLVDRAAAEVGFDPRRSVVIGDQPGDIELARVVGARSVLVRTGYGRKFERELKPDWTAETLLDAAWAIEQQGRLAA
jgi:D-glycero-D-manno-heptose 1,7-bisphosphate phosphatase